MSDLGNTSPLATSSVRETLQNTINDSSEKPERETRVEAPMAGSFYEQHNTKNMAHDKEGCVGGTSQELSQLNRDQMFPFLKLPQEMRDRIYQYVLGGQFIHIHIRYEADYTEPMRPIYHKGKRPCHTICSAEDTEESVYAKFKAGQEEGLGFWNRHDECCIRQNESTRKLDLRLLRVCKQIYEETRLIPYTANTFSILDRSLLEKLIQQLLPDQMHSLRALHLNVTLTSHKDALEWTHIFDDPRILCYEPKVSKGLKLHTLHLCITQNFSDKKNYRSFVDDYPIFWVAGLLRLRNCPLKEVKVVMTDYTFPRKKGRLNAFNEALSLMMKKYKLTMAEKQDYCEQLRKTLLGLTQWVPKADKDPHSRIQAEEQAYW